MPNSHSHHKTENQKFLVFSLSMSIFLFLGKSITGFFSGSASLLASSVDSLMDGLSTLVNMFFLHEASKPADKEHPFGHGKFEAFSGMIQGILIVSLSVSLLIYSLTHFSLEKSGDTQSFEMLGIGMLILSIVAPLVLSTLMKRQAEKTKSLVLEAEHSHFFADGLMNGGALLGLVLATFFDLFWADSLIGIVIACYLIWTAKEILQESFDVLVDAELPENIQKNIQKILDTAVHEEEISGWHALRTRRSGMEYHIDVHLEFPEEISLKNAHQKSHLVEEKILQKFPNTIILTHFDFENDL